MASQKCGVYVGAQNGLLKGVDMKNKVFYNFNAADEQNKENEITSLCWAEEAEEKIYVGQKNHVVKLFDCSLRGFEKTLELKSGDGFLRSICTFNNKIVTAEESGQIRIWDEDGQKQEVEINAGKNLYRMRQNPSKRHHVATGGEENDLKIWDLQQSSEPIFKAKNVRNDFLDLRVPVWVTDMQFIPGGDKVVTCTRHHQVRVYDPNLSRRRRPVIDMEFECHPLISISLTHNEHQVIVGSSRGRMALLDLRKKAMVHVFKGFAGSISSILCHPTQSLVASTSLDRFLRLHDLNSRKLLRKVYMKSKLNCLLMRSDEMDVPLAENESEMNTVARVKQPIFPAGKDDDANDDDVWNSMKVVKEKLKKLKKRSVDHTDSLMGIKNKKLKPLQ